MQMEAAIDIKIPVSKEIGHNHVLDDKIDEAYLNEVLQIQINKDLRRDDFKIVFSPEHGRKYAGPRRHLSVLATTSFRSNLN